MSPRKTAAIILSCLLLGPLILLPRDWSGWITLYLSLSVPLLYRPFSSDKRLLFPALVSAFLVACLAVVNSYIWVLPGGGADAARFFRQASFFAEVGYLPDYNGGATVYVSALSIILGVFGPSALLAHSLSALATTLTLPVLHRLRILLFGEHHASGLMLLFSVLLPSSLLFKSATLRESWQCLFFISFVYFVCKLRRRFTLPDLLLAIGSGSLAASLHTALALIFALGGLVLTFALSWRTNRSLGSKVSIGMITLALASPLAWFGFSIASADRRFTEVSDEVSPGSIDSALEGLQREERGNATYANAPGMTNPALRVPLGLVYYWLAPFPWQIRNLLDVHALFENLLRTLLFLGCIRNLRAERDTQNKQPIILAIFLLFSLEFVWSMGTVNWGTAIRHHIPALGVLFAVGYPLTRSWRHLPRIKIGV